MDNVSIIGIDISKRSFQLQHGATASGEPVLRGKLSRGGVLKFLAFAAAVPGGDGDVRRRPTTGDARSKLSATRSA